MKIKFHADSSLGANHGADNALYLASLINGKMEYNFSENNYSFLHEGPGVIIILNELNHFISGCKSPNNEWVPLKVMYSSIAVGRIIGDVLYTYINEPINDGAFPIDIMPRREVDNLSNKIEELLKKFGRLD